MPTAQNISGLHVTLLATPPEQKFAPADYADKPMLIPPAAELSYYVAINEVDVMERCVAISAGDRQIVAALVGNWVAEGYRVDRCGPKELVKLVRKQINTTQDGGAANQGGPLDEAAA